MPQSLVQIYIHLVFSTKNRTPFLKDLVFRDRTHRYLAAIFKNRDSPAVIVGGVEDHVHALCHLGKTISVSDLVRDLKRDSSKWVKAEQPHQPDFHWQRGYGAFSISPSHISAITEYIQNQEDHHRTETFQDERLGLTNVPLSWGIGNQQISPPQNVSPLFLTPVQFSS